MGRAGWARWPRGRPGPPNVQRRPATATRPADSGRSEAGHLPMLENPHQPGDPTPDKRKVDKRTAAGGHVHGPNGPRRPPHAPPRPARPAHPPPHKRPHAPPTPARSSYPPMRDRGAATGENLQQAVVTAPCGPAGAVSPMFSRVEGIVLHRAVRHRRRLKATPPAAWCRTTPDIPNDPGRCPSGPHAAAQLPRHTPRWPRQDARHAG